MPCRIECRIKKIIDDACGNVGRSNARSTLQTLPRSASLSRKVNGARILARQGGKRRRERGHATGRQDEESSAMIREKGAEAGRMANM